MAYQEITQYSSPNYTPASQVPRIYGKARTIEGVVYHWWGDPNLKPSFQGIINFLCRPNGNTSAHVVGEAGRIAWIIDAQHCLPIDATEVLTPNGYVPLSKMKVGDTVFQYDIKTGIIDRTTVLDVVDKRVEKVYKMRQTEATADHDLIVQPNRKAKLSKQKMKVLFNKDKNTRRLFPRASGTDSKGVDLTDDEIRYLVAIQADGSFIKGKDAISFHFKKDRKTQRIEELLKKLDRQYKKYTSPLGNTRFRVYHGERSWAERYLPNKSFSDFWLNMNDHQIDIFIEELFLWDGDNGRLRSYSTTDKKSSDIVQAIFSLAGYYPRCDVAEARGSRKMSYRIFPTLSYGLHGGMDIQERETEVSCITVEKGAIIIRQYGKTQIIGNCAWHAGNSYANSSLIGYECNPRLSDGDYETMGEFHYDMEKAYGRRLAIHVHKEFSSTQCSPVDKNRVRAIADRFHAGQAQKVSAPPAPTKKAVPAPEKFSAPRRFKVKIDKAELWDLESNPNWKSVKSFTRDTVLEFAGVYHFNNSVYYTTAYSMSKGVKTGVNAVDLEEIVAKAPEPTPAPAPKEDPEWVKNLKDILPIKLTVVQPQGVKVINLLTGETIGDKIPANTQIDVRKITTVGGKEYYISSYAADKGVPHGLPKESLAERVEPIEKEKPEWLNNLHDIEDQDFWTRGRTTVFELKTGKAVEVLSRNKKVRITHTVHFLENEFMITEDGKAILPVMLSDKPVESDKPETTEPEIKELTGWNSELAERMTYEIKQSQELNKENNNLLKQILEIVQKIWKAFTMIFKVKK